MPRGGDTVFKKGLIPWNKGLTYSAGPRSEESRKRMSLAAKGKPKSEAHKKAVSIGMNNLPQDVKDRKALAVSLAQKGNTNRKGKTQVAWNKGRPTGKHSWNYKGGITKIDKILRSILEYKQWRSDCFERDRWTCQTCDINEVYVTVHHIKSFSTIIKENNITCIADSRGCRELWDRTNGVTLCEKCHSLTDNYCISGKNGGQDCGAGI